jgi:hypothetical protein
MFIYIHILSYQTYITKYSFKACFDYNIVTKRISVFVFNAIFVFILILLTFSKDIVMKQIFRGWLVKSITTAISNI